jgi:hypothetical protein
MKHLLRFALELMQQFWPLLLAICVMGLAISIAYFARVFMSGQQPEKNVTKKKKRRPTHSAEKIEPPANPSGLLNLLNPECYWEFDEVYVPRFEGAGYTLLDHIVLSTHGIFIVHVQHESGLITGDIHQRHWMCVNGKEKKVLTNPIPRNAYHVRALARFLELPEALFFSIIYFDNPVTFTSRQPAHVITRNVEQKIASYKADLISREVLSQVNERLTAHQATVPLNNYREEYRITRACRLREVKEPQAA